MIFKDKKEEALGGNYKIKGLKVFGSKENLFNNVKKYRTVYDVIESSYIYCEFSFYNKLFDEFEIDVLKELIDLIMVELDREYKKAHYIERIQKRK